MQHKNWSSLAYRQPMYKGAKGSLLSPNEQHSKQEHVTVKAILRRAWDDEVRDPVGQQSRELKLAAHFIALIEVFNPQ